MTENFGAIMGRWLARLRRGERVQPRLELLERIALGQRQWLALVQAEGRRILVATSAEGGPAFYPLGEQPRGSAMAPRTTRVSTRRMSW